MEKWWGCDTEVGAEHLDVVVGSDQATATKHLVGEVGGVGAQGSGILYCATRDQTELVAEYATSQGIPVTPYHAGLHPDRKRALQEAFIADEIPVIAATNALVTRTHIPPRAVSAAGAPSASDATSHTSFQHLAHRARLPHRTAPATRPTMSGLAPLQMLPQLAHHTL